MSIMVKNLSFLVKNQLFICLYIIAAAQKARAVYDNILRLSDDADVNEVIKFLRQREVVHFQRFGEANRAKRNTFDRTKSIKTSHFNLLSLLILK